MQSQEENKTLETVTLGRRGPEKAINNTNSLHSGPKQMPGTKKLWIKRFPS
jgi:hypothetical protein